MMRYATTLILLALFGCGQSPQTHTVEKPVIEDKQPTADQLAAAEALRKIESEEHQKRIEAETQDHLHWLEFEATTAERDATSVVHNTFKETNKQLLREVASGSMTAEEGDAKRMEAVQQCCESLAEIVRKSRAKKK